MYGSIALGMRLCYLNGMTFHIFTIGVAQMMGFLGSYTM